MPQSPQVSVIIPTCGRSELLIECIVSILHNDFTDFEILVVDQDPKRTQKTELANRFSGNPQIKYLFLDQANLSLARNKGIEHARGEIIVFADDDVKVDPGWLKAYVEAFTSVQHDAPGVVAGQLEPIWLSPRPEWYPEEREFILGIYNCRGDELVPMPQGELPVGANFAILRKVIDKVGMFDERVGFSYARKASMLAGEDGLFVLKAKQANYSIYYQPQARAWHKISKNKLTKKYFFKRNFWQGATDVVVLYLSGAITPDDFPGVIRWHIRYIGGQVWRFFHPKDKSRSLTQAKTWMRLAAICLNSLGVIYYSLKFLWTRKLP